MQPHRRQPTRLRCPWNSPGKNTRVGCHFLLQCMKVKSESEVSQSCLTLHDPMDCSLPGFSVHGIFQAIVLEWVAISFSNNGILLSHKKEWNNDICSQMDATRDYTKWNKSEREKTPSITYMWNLKYDTNEPIYEIEMKSVTWRIHWLLLRGRGVREVWIGNLGLADANWYI